MFRPAFLLILAAAPLSAQTFEDVRALDAQVAAVAGDAVPIDARLKLARCPEPVVIDPPNLGAVAVRCASLGWRIRVARRIAEVPPAKVIAIRRGDPVNLVSSGDGFEVSTRAVAMEDAAVGHPVRVKSLTTAAISVGIAMAPGNVSAGR